MVSEVVHDCPGIAVEAVLSILGFKMTRQDTPGRVYIKQFENGHYQQYRLNISRRFTYD